MKKMIIMKVAFFVIFNIHFRVESCATDQFQCENGECIPSAKRCDDNFDCGDRSDEENCSEVNQCPEGLHRCFNGQCVVDLNLCPTSTLSQTEISSTHTSPLQSTSLFMSTSFGIVATTSLYTSESSVIETTRSSVESITPITEDHIPDTENGYNLNYLWLLLLVPVIVIIIGGIVYWYRNAERRMR
ncbi:unnamed protein product [Mytilus coruscus]|uniref:Uncharacterized protein n=1 Tax=Mytilus coruscus TaxID=42192 RepID=A0A6J8EFM6_MYTCO|nr:unnamed protein product [Mytilus coruscus]